MLSQRQSCCDREAGWGQHQKKMTNKTGGQVAWPQGRRLREGATLNIEEKNKKIFFYLLPPATLRQKDKLFVII